MCVNILWSFVHSVVNKKVEISYFFFSESAGVRYMSYILVYYKTHTAGSDNWYLYMINNYDYWSLSRIPVLTRLPNGKKSSFNVCNDFIYQINIFLRDRKRTNHEKKILYHVSNGPLSHVCCSSMKKI